MMPSVPKVMRRVALGGLVLLCALTVQAQEGNGSHESILKAFYRVDLDPDAVYRVSGLTLRKDNMKLQLDGGLVFLVKPLEGEVTGAVFIGAGKAAMRPVNGSGRYMLAKYYGEEVLAEPFD